MKIYNASDYKGSKLVSEESLKLRNLDKVDQQFNKDSIYPQSGTAVAEAISPKANEVDLLKHKENRTVHVTTLDREKWNAKVGEAELDEVREQFHQEIKDKIVGALHYKGTVDNYNSLPEGITVFIGDFYNVRDTGLNYAWDGTQWVKLSDDLTGLTNKLTNLDGRVTELEEATTKITVDQHYDEESKNPQSGTAVAEAIQNLASSSDLELHTTNDTIHIMEDSEHSVVKTQQNLTKSAAANYKSCAFTPMYSGELKSAKFICRPTGITNVEVWCQLYKATEIDSFGVGIKAKYLCTSTNSQTLTNNTEITFTFDDAKCIIDGDLYLLQFVSESEKELRDLTSNTNLQLTYFSTLETLEGQQMELAPKFYSSPELYSTGCKAPYFPSYEFTFISPVVFTADGKTRLTNHDEYYKNELVLTQKKLNQHVADNFRHTTGDQLKEAVTQENIVDHPSVTGNIDKTFNYCNINEHIPTGRLRTVKMKAQQAGNITGSTIACYLSIYQLNTDGTSYHYLGTSDNGINQAIKQDYLWIFKNTNIDLAGRGLRLYLTSTPSYPMVTGLKFAAHCTAASSANTNIVFNNSPENFTPEIIWGIDERKEKFAPIEHTQNTEIHVSTEDREKWNRIDELISNVDTIEESYQTEEDVVALIPTTEIIKEHTCSIDQTGRANAETCKCVLNKKYITQPGRLTHFKMYGRSDIKADSAIDVYLHLLTSEDGTTWTYLAHSENATHARRNAWAEWIFNNETHLDDKHHVMMVFSDTIETVESSFWKDSCKTGMSGIRRTNDDAISCMYSAVSSTIQYLPIVEIVIEEHTVLPEHCFDKDLHMSKEEKDDITSRLSLLEARIQALESQLKSH